VVCDKNNDGDLCAIIWSYTEKIYNFVTDSTLRVMHMKRILFAVLFSLISFGLSAQKYKEPEKDTLVVTKVLYQMQELPVDYWPCKEIYRNAFGFVFLDNQLDVIERKEYASAVYYRLKVYNTEEYYDLWTYEMPDSVLRIRFEDYQFYCKESAAKRPLQLVEQKPTFNGGDANEFSKWVNSQLIYPKKAKKNGIQGRVTLQFTIDKSGEIRDVYVIRGVDRSLDAEAYRIVSSSPRWSPGMHEGEPVSVTYRFPVIFQLR
jgi:TonB family protein